MHCLRTDRYVSRYAPSNMLSAAVSVALTAARWATHEALTVSLILRRFSSVFSSYSWGDANEPVAAVWRVDG